MKPLLLFLLAGLASKSPGDPVFPGLTAVYDHRRQLVKIKWQHNDKRIICYVLQRSTNNVHWANLQEISITRPLENRFITYLDLKPGAGKNYYRLKTVLPGAATGYTASVWVIIGEPGNQWLVYPVPVGDVLNLRYNGNQPIPGVIGVVIQHSNGRVFHRLRYASSTREIQIPVQNLGSGTYDLRIIINNELVWNQRFVK